MGKNGAFSYYFVTIRAVLCVVVWPFLRTEGEVATDGRSAKLLKKTCKNRQKTLAQQNLTCYTFSVQWERRWICGKNQLPGSRRSGRSDFRRRRMESQRAIKREYWFGRETTQNAWVFSFFVMFAAVLLWVERPFFYVDKRGEILWKNRRKERVGPRRPAAGKRMAAKFCHDAQKFTETFCVKRKKKSVYANGDVFVTWKTAHVCYNIKHTKPQHD